MVGSEKMSDERPFRSEHCDDCICVTWSFANNERGMCCGIVKNPNPVEDVIRFCLIDFQDAQYLDLTVSEALITASHLSETAFRYIKEQIPNLKK